MTEEIRNPGTEGQRKVSQGEFISREDVECSETNSRFKGEEEEEKEKGRKKRQAAAGSESSQRAW